MSFIKLNYLIPAMVSFFIVTLIIVKKGKELDGFIQNTFFKKPSRILWLRRILLILGIGFLLLASLDPRGPQERVESRIPDQKTIIIIDSSASMLAEDVRPNRFKKSILMARHFIKKAFGHKIAVVLFSDTQKRLVPFTDDLDLLDARVAGLEDLKLYDGGSNISQAIKESLGYFLVDGGKVDEVGGNILLFTDSEGHDEEIGIELPEQVTLAAIGIGTAKGARIPNRDKYGVFRGYKKYKSEEVISRLNEGWLKSLSKSIKSYKYWVANSYTIPTEEVLRFFNGKFNQKVNKGMATVRPVMVEAYLVPAIILLILSFLLYFKTSYVLASLVLILLNVKGNYASDLMAEQVTLLKEKLKNGELDKNGKLKFAEILLQSKEPEAAKVLYEENIENALPEHVNNYAISLIQNKKSEEAIRVLGTLQMKARSGAINLTDTQKTELRQNMLLALQKQKSQQKQKQKQKKEEEKEKKKQKQKESGEEGDSGNNKNEKSEKDGKDKKDDKEKDDKKSDGKDGKEKKEKQDQAKRETLKERQDKIRKKRKMVKIPGLIKQIMSDDRSLQKKYLDTSTTEPRQYQKKDW